MISVFMQQSQYLSLMNEKSTFSDDEIKSLSVVAFKNCFILHVGEGQEGQGKRIQIFLSVMYPEPRIPPSNQKVNHLKPFC